MSVILRNDLNKCWKTESEKTKPSPIALVLSGAFHINDFFCWNLIKIFTSFWTWSSYGMKGPSASHWRPPWFYVCKPEAVFFIRLDMRFCMVSPYTSCSYTAWLIIRPQVTFFNEFRLKVKRRMMNWGRSSSFPELRWSSAQINASKLISKEMNLSSHLTLAKLLPKKSVQISIPGICLPLWLNFIQSVTILVLYLRYSVRWDWKLKPNSKLIFSGSGEEKDGITDKTESSYNVPSWLQFQLLIFCIEIKI